MPLSEAAKKEIADAVRIVREDKFEAFTRGVLQGHARPAPQVTEEDLEEQEGEEDTPKVPAPPQKDSAGKADPPVAKRRDPWWGEIED